MGRTWTEVQFLECLNYGNRGVPGGKCYQLGESYAIGCPVLVPCCGQSLVGAARGKHGLAGSAAAQARRCCRQGVCPSALLPRQVLSKGDLTWSPEPCPRATHICVYQLGEHLPHCSLPLFLREVSGTNYSPHGFS